jgi:hypothetical protein
MDVERQRRKGQEIAQQILLRALEQAKAQQTSYLALILLTMSPQKQNKARQTFVGNFQKKVWILPLPL